MINPVDPLQQFCAKNMSLGVVGVRVFVGVFVGVCVDVLVGVCVDVFVGVFVLVLVGV